MAATLRVHLSEDQQAELIRLSRDRQTPARARERLEMVRLADAGWTVPKIAAYLHRHEQTVRKYVAAFLTAGFAALPDRRGGGRPRRITDDHLAAVETLLDTQTRTWTTPQVAAWLAREHGVAVHPGHLSRLLHQRGYRWKRTRRSLVHKRRDPDLHAAKAADLEALKKAGPSGSA
jgi:transposase